MKKRWIILIILVLLIVIGWYNFFVPHGSARRRLAEYKKELIAKGEKLDLASLAMSRAASDSNIAKQFLAFGASWGIPGSSDFPTAMAVIAPGAAEISYTNLDANQMASYASNKLYTAQLRELLSRGTIDFDVDFSQGVETPLPHLAEMKRLALQLSYTARQALQEHDLDEAALDLGMEADLLRLWNQEPILISTLVRIACANIGIYAGWEGLQADGWSDAQLSALQSKWQQLNFFTNLDAVLATERIFGIDGIAKARKFTNATQLIDSMAIMPGIQPSGTFREWFKELMDDPKAALEDVYERYPKFWMWKSKWSYDEELCGLQTVTAEMEACRKIDSLTHCALILGELPNQTSNILHSYPKFESHFLAGYGAVDAIMHRGLMKSAQTETAKRLLVTAIALKRYYLRKGKWPEKLDELVPEFLETIPLDFMDGKPLRYKPTADGRYLLYSVGEDGKDDGGDGTPPPPNPGTSLPSNPFHFFYMRDIVWPQPATEEQIKDYEAKHPKNTTMPPTSR